MFGHTLMGKNNADMMFISMHYNHDSLPAMTFTYTACVSTIFALSPKTLHTYIPSSRGVVALMVYVY